MLASILRYFSSDFGAFFRVFGKFVNNFERFRKNIFETRDHFRSIALLKTEIASLGPELSRLSQQFFCAKKSYLGPLSELAL